MQVVTPWMTESTGETEMTTPRIMPTPPLRFLIVFAFLFCLQATVNGAIPPPDYPMQLFRVECNKEYVYPGEGATFRVISYPALWNFLGERRFFYVRLWSHQGNYAPWSVSPSAAGEVAELSLADYVSRHYKEYVWFPPDDDMAYEMTINVRRSRAPDRLAISLKTHDRDIIRAPFEGKWFRSEALLDVRHDPPQLPDRTVLPSVGFTPTHANPDEPMTVSMDALNTSLTAYENVEIEVVFPEVPFDMFPGVMDNVLPDGEYEDWGFMGCAVRLRPFGGLLGPERQIQTAFDFTLLDPEWSEPIPFELTVYGTDTSSGLRGAISETVHDAIELGNLKGNVELIAVNGEADNLPGILYYGDLLRYRMTWTNEASQEARGVQVRLSPRPVDAEYVAGSATNGGQVAGDQLTWSTDVLAAGASWAAEFELQLLDPPPVGFDHVRVVATATATIGDAGRENQASAQRMVESALKMRVQVFEILEGGERRGPIDRVYQGTHLEWQATLTNVTTETITVDAILTAPPTNTDLVADSLQPAGAADGGNIEWREPVDISPGASHACSYRCIVADPIPDGETLVFVPLADASYTRRGTLYSKSAGGIVLPLRRESELAIDASPRAITADGEATSTITATLTWQREPRLGEVVWFGVNPPVMLLPPEGGAPSASILVATDENGVATARLRAPGEPGEERVHASVMVDGETLMDDVLVRFGGYELEAEPTAFRYTRVPATEFWETQTVERAPGPDVNQVTLFGRTEVPILLQLTDTSEALDLGSQRILLTSQQRDEAGAAHINFIDEIVTDGLGMAGTILEVNDLWRTGRTFEEIVITAELEDNPGIRAVIEVDVLDNREEILGIYAAAIPEGVIWDNGLWDVLRQHQPEVADTYEQLLELKYMAGHVNNALNSLLFDWVPNSWNNQFDEFTCGGYQAAILKLMNRLHYNNNDQGQTDWLLNGLDYGPIFEAGGLHVAAILYPRVSGRADWKNDDTLILDPWMAQKPRVYGWEAWFDALSGKNMGLVESFVEWGLVETWSYGIALMDGLAGTSNDYNNHYPANGLDYPISDVVPINPHADNPKLVQAHCPVHITIADGEGRISGYREDAAPGESPLVEQIPNVAFSVVADDDGTSLWYVQVPDESLTLRILAYGDGPMDLTLMTSGPGNGRIHAFPDVPVQAGDRATIPLEPGAGAVPLMLSFTDGRTIEADMTAIDGTPIGGEAKFKRGDANASGKSDLGDAITILEFLFADGHAGCLDAFDINDDGKNDLADPITLLTYLYANGEAPAAPFEACDVDPTADDPLDCASFAPCQ